MYVCIETDKYRVQNLRDVLLCVLFQIYPLEADYPHIGHWTYMCQTRGPPKQGFCHVSDSDSYVGSIISSETAQVTQELCQWFVMREAQQPIFWWREKKRLRPCSPHGLPGSASQEQRVICPYYNPAVICVTDTCIHTFMHS